MNRKGKKRQARKVKQTTYDFFCKPITSNLDHLQIRSAKDSRTPSPLAHWRGNPQDIDDEDVIATERIGQLSRGVKHPDECTTGQKVANQVGNQVGGVNRSQPSDIRSIYRSHINQMPAQQQSPINEERPVDLHSNRVQGCQDMATPWFPLEKFGVCSLQEMRKKTGLVQTQEIEQQSRVLHDMRPQQANLVFQPNNKPAHNSPNPLKGPSQQPALGMVCIAAGWRENLENTNPFNNFQNRPSKNPTNSGFQSLLKQNGLLQPLGIRR